MTTDRIDESGLPIYAPGDYDFVRVVDRATGASRNALAPEVTAAARLLTEKLGEVVADAEADIAPVIAGLGYLPPVPYASGLNVNSTRFTVIRDGRVYAPAASVPFTTGAWNAGQWRLVQGVVGVDLAAPTGAGMVGSKWGTVKDALERAPLIFASVTEMASTASALLANGQRAFINDRSGNSGGWVWDSFSTREPDGVYVIGSAPTGRWMRIQPPDNINQGPDFVSAVRGMIRPSRLFIRRGVSDLFVTVLQSTEADEEHYAAEYRFLPDVDGFWRVRDIKVGKSKGAVHATKVADTSDLAGTWITSAPPNWYTTEEGARFSIATPRCTQVDIQFRMDSRGGVWQLELVNHAGDIVRSQRFSTYSPDTVFNRSYRIGEGLPAGEYTVRGLFLGADPFNAPSSGPARGWLIGGSGPTITCVDRSPVGELAPGAETLMTASVEEFAIQARPAGSSIPYAWVPSHGSVPGATSGHLARFYVDPVSGPGISALAASVIPQHNVEIRAFYLHQRYRGRNSNDTDETDLWQGYFTHSFTRESGSMRMQHRVRFMQKTQVAGSYMSQFSGRHGVLPNIKLSLGGKSFINRETSGANTSEDIPVNRSCLRWGGSFEPGVNYAYARTVSDVYESANLSEPYARPAFRASLITDRPDGNSKVYHYVAESGSEIPQLTEWQVTSETISGLVRSPFQNVGGVGVA